MGEQSLMLDAVGVREVADFAASLRGKSGDPLYVIATFDPSIQDYRLTVATSPPPEPDPSTAVVPVNTAAVQPNRLTVTDVTIKAEGTIDGTPIGVSTELFGYDALFWSESAVEKFLFPYYASKYQWAAAQVLTLLSQVFYGFVPTLTSGLPSAAQPAELIPFAVAHLPRSDYVPVGIEGAGTPGPTDNFLMHDLWLLSRDPATGEVVHRSLAEYA